jgi:hypothetical protein
MIGHAEIPQSSELVGESRVYCVCLFPRGAVVPTVKLLEAASDAEAIQLAFCISPSGEREVWDRHRLVARLAPVRFSSVALGAD